MNGGVNTHNETMKVTYPDDLKTDEDLRPVPVKDQIAKINQINAFLRTHKQKRSLLDMSRYLKVRGPWEG